MTSIVDYRHTVYYFNGKPYSLADFFHSSAWEDYVVSLSTIMPVDEGVALLMRLADQKKLPIDIPLFIDVAFGEQPKEASAIIDALNEWKENEQMDELKRIRIMDKFLQTKWEYPYILYPIFNQRYSSTEKAQQLYETIDVWGHERMKRPFFMLVFKYSKLNAKTSATPNLNVTYKRGRKMEDSLYQVYIDASNGLWDFVQHLEGKIDVVGRRQKKREGAIFNAIDLENEWVQWMEKERAYRELLAYRALVVNKKRDRARFTVFIEFLWMYLKRDAFVDDLKREQYLKIQKVSE
jgi:hypothetical protein